MKVYLFNNGVHSISTIGTIETIDSYEYELKIGGGSGAYGLIPKISHVFLYIYVSFMVIVDNKKFKTC